MKWYDALRNDAELREDVAQLFEAERMNVLHRIEALPASDSGALQAEKAFLDALRRVQLTLCKEEVNRVRRRD